MPPCHLYGAAVRRAPHHSGRARALTLPCGWNIAGGMRAGAVLHAGASVQPLNPGPRLGLTMFSYYDSGGVGAGAR